MKTKKTLISAVIIISAIVFCAPVVHAQNKRTNIWYFGANAGMDFNSGAPVTLINGAMNTVEGCSSICDNNGNLLFYTDGVTVYNKVHSSMPNGFGLYGGNSCSQSALIVPEPGSSTLYYIFTQDQVAGPNGFCYSIVDITLDGGNGDVINKNTVILNSVPLCEKLAGTMHANGQDVWVCVHGHLTNTLYAYQVTPSGIKPPVISNTGTIYSGSPAWTGYLKFSHNGSKLATSVYATYQVDLFDFDNATGVFSNPATGTFPSNQQPYGIEFSPADTKLYVTAGAASAFNIYQFDMNAGSNAAIVASQVSVGSNNSYIFGIQSAPDGKVYVSYYSDTWIGAIDFPELQGVSCNFNDSALYLGGAQTQAGLPNYISNYLQITGINENLAGGNNTIQVSPNPFSATTVFTFPYEINKHDNYSLSVSDIVGKTVYYSNNIKQKFEFSREGLDNGIYFYRITCTEKTLQSGKLLIER